MTFPPEAGTSSRLRISTAKKPETDGTVGSFQTGEGDVAVRPLPIIGEEATCQPASASRRLN